MLTVGESFPPFHCQACSGLTIDDQAVIQTGDYEGRWKLFLFYPKDFTFVCPTELIDFAKAAPQFDERNVVLIAGSTDNEFSHMAWRQTHPGLKDLPYPLIAAQKLAADLGILDPKENVCLRASFLVDPDNVIQWVSANNLSVGRSVDEALRIIDAVQSGELCACGWTPGEAHVAVN